MTSEEAIRKLTDPTEGQLHDAWEWLKAYALSGRKNWRHAARLLIRLKNLEQQQKPSGCGSKEEE